MNRNKLKTYAPQARRDFIQAVTARAAQYGLTPEKTEPMTIEGNVAVIAGEAHPKAIGEKREKLAARIERDGFEQVMEQVAYTWFNRLVAIRFMELHGYLDHGYRVLSSPEGDAQPEIVEHAEHIDVPGINTKKVIELKLDGTKEEELYRLLLIGQCNALQKSMPFLFESIDDETELLLPDNLLHSDSLIRTLVEKLSEEDCQDVEVIGWLYQFYIAEKKDDVFAALKKGKKITPENIPAATQLFTPHWIVRYLVENSLGRLWMLNHPDSRLTEQMDYYIEPEEPEADFLRIGRPEEIKICDPACGSGHMLTYAFDLLYAIYEEQGYKATDIPRQILENNLYGIEIDPRAGVLAAFALTMKAREKYRRFLTPGKVAQPNICVLKNIHIEPEELDEYMDKVGRDLFTGELEDVVNQFEEADNFGSLIRPSVTDVSEVLELLHERQLDENLFLADVHRRVLKALKQADYLSPKYHVVVANPPYVGGKGMNPSLKKFAATTHPHAKLDVFSMFVERFVETMPRFGYVSLMTPFTWMFISSFERFRVNLLKSSTFISLVRPEYHAFFDSAFVPICAFILRKHAIPGYPGTFIDLSRFYGADSQGPKTIEAIKSLECDWRYSVSADELRKIPGAPIAFWVSDAVRKAFSFPQLKSVSELRAGITTGNNDKYVRFWHEVEWRSFAIGVSSADELWRSSQLRWVPLKAGGDFRKWFGNREKVIRFDRTAYNQLKTEGNRCASEDRYFCPSLTWSDIGATDQFGVRACEEGFIFSTVGHSIFSTSDNLLPIAALLCSRIASKFIHLINPTFHANPGDVAKLPFKVSDSLNQRATEIAKKCIDISREDWNSFEFSWDFERSPLFSTDGHGSSVAEAVASRMRIASSVSERLRRLEETNNELFSVEYGLSADFASCVASEHVTLSQNPRYRYGADKNESELNALFLSDTIKEFASYAVGCMFGRYSLDKPGLILVNQGETADNYRQQIPHPTFPPDEDNVIPLLDADWFTDDISRRFKEFLKITFGAEHFDENLAFLENALYPDNLTGKTRKTLRNYFLKEFYKHHLSVYKRRPIYWLFNSGKQQGFQALVYLHRYHEGTLGRMRTEYVIPLMGKYTGRINHLTDEIAAATSSQQQKRLEKEKVLRGKQLAELQAYDEKLRHYADQRISLDLDDGVKVNYGKFGDLLAEVKAVTGKKPS